MPQANLEILIQARDEATKVLQQVNATVADSSKQLQQAGLVATAAGAAMLGALGFAVKAAADESAMTDRLRVSMQNVGLSYDASRESLEKWIDAQQQSTAFSDTAQRQALSSLIVLTKDMTQAQNVLTTAMDLARWKQLDLQTSTQLMMQVYSGNNGMLSRYGIMVDKTATSTEVLAQVQAMAAGQAQRYGATLNGQMELLKNNFSDVIEAIGNTLVPTVQNALAPISELVKRLRDTNPEMLKMLTTATALAGGISLLGGGMLLAASFIPKLVAGYNTLIVVMNAVKAGALALNAALGPIGWLAIAAAAIGTTVGLVAAYRGLTSATRDASSAQNDLNDSLDMTHRRINAALGDYDAFGLATDDTKARMQELNQTLADNEAAQKKDSVAIATATWQEDGYTKQTQLFTQADIDAAEASGKKITRLRTQADTMSDSVDTVNGLTSATDDFTRSEYAAAQAARDFANAKAASGQGSSASSTDDAIAQLKATNPQLWAAYMNSLQNSGVDADTLTRNYLREAGLLPSSSNSGASPSSTDQVAGYVKSLYPSYDVGGVVKETGLALVHKDETVIPADARLGDVVVQVFLDGEQLSGKLVRKLVTRIGKDMRLQGAVG